jgi:D-3-phosphoglycerate dehydrogenase
MYRFLLYEPIHEAGIRVLRAVGEVRMASSTDEDTIVKEIGDIDGVVVRAKGRVTRRVLEHAPRLKVVGRHGTGVDNIDLEAATEHGVQVVKTPEATTEAVAEHTVGLMLALSKKILQGDAGIRSGHFEARYSLMGREMCGRILGVAGFGRIGRRVAQICHFGLGMPVLYYDVRPAPELERQLGARRLELHELLASAEYISVHVPLLPQTRGLIGEAEFALMRPDAMFFNTSRGPVVDEGALYRALAAGTIAGAGIDVYEEEPTPADNPLFGLENVVLTPHMSANTEEAMRKMSLVAEDLVSVLQGRKPRYPVNQLD